MQFIILHMFNHGKLTAIYSYNTSPTSFYLRKLKPTLDIHSLISCWHIPMASCRRNHICAGREVDLSMTPDTFSRPVFDNITWFCLEAHFQPCVQLFQGGKLSVALSYLQKQWSLQMWRILISSTLLLVVIMKFTHVN